MHMTDFALLKSRFLKTYSNLPIQVRKEVISIIDEKPLSWNIVYSEVENDTVIGKKALKKLEELGFI